MNMENKSPFSSDKMAWGLTILAAALLLELILAGYGLANASFEFDPQTMGSQQANPLQIAMGCLAPISAVLKIVGIILVFVDSRRLGGTHRGLALTSLILYLVSIATGIGAIVLSFGATMQGSLQSYFLTTWLAAAGGILAFAALSLLIFVPAPQWAKIALVVGLAAYLAATVGTTLLTNNSTSLSSYEMMGTTYYIPKIDLNRTEGIFPLLSIAGTLAVVIYLAVYLVLAIQSWQVANREIPESVS
jgi:hypothetical protein